MTDLIQKKQYENTQGLARAPSVVFTSEDLINEGFISDYLNARTPKQEEYALTNEDLDNYEFLDVPKLRNYNKSLWEPSRLVEDRVNPRIFEENAHLRDYWKPGKYPAITLKGELKKEDAQKGIVRKFLGFFKRA